MSKQDQDIITKALSSAKQAGADGADVSFIKGGGQDVQVRLGKVESAERAEDYREADEAEDHDGRRRVEVAALAGVDDAVPAASTSAYLGLHIRHERQRARQRERTAAPHP